MKGSGVELRAITVSPTKYNQQDPRWEDNEDETTFWPRVMWADCGVTTGIAVIWFDPVMLLDPRKATSKSLLAWYVTHVTGPENRQAYEIARLARGLGGGIPDLDETDPLGHKSIGLVVGAESFQARAANGTDDFLSSPRIASRLDYQMWLGVIDYDGVTRRRPVLLQSPSEIDKTSRGDERLRNLQLWVPGADHRRDALKHCLTHLGKVRTAGLGAFEALYGWNPDWDNFE